MIGWEWIDNEALFSFQKILQNFFQILRHIESLDACMEY